MLRGNGFKNSMLLLALLFLSAASIVASGGAPSGGSFRKPSSAPRSRLRLKIAARLGGTT